MRIQPVAYRYAKSLLDIALEQGQLDQVHQDMTLLAETCTESADLRQLLKSPVVRGDQKGRVLNRVFAGRIGKVVLTFLDVLLRKGREGLLLDITRAFQEIYREHKGIVVCKVTTAVPLSATEREEVRRITAPRFPGKTIEIQTFVDPSILGGGIIQVGDLQWDASVRNKLHVIKRTFAQNPYIPKL